MSDFVFRSDEELGVLRSTGDELPGILVVALVDGRASLAVSQGWQPPNVDESRVELSIEGDGSVLQESIAVDAGDVVDGLADKAAAEALWQLVGASIAEVVPMLLGQAAFDELRLLVDLAEIVRGKLEQRVELEGWGA